MKLLQLLNREFIYYFLYFNINIYIMIKIFMKVNNIMNSNHIKDKIKSVSNEVFLDSRSAILNIDILRSINI